MSDAEKDTHDQQVERATNAILARRHGPLGIFVTREMAGGLARAVLDAVTPQEEWKRTAAIGELREALRLLKEEPARTMVSAAYDYLTSPLLTGSAQGALTKERGGATIDLADPEAQP